MPNAWKELQEFLLGDEEVEAIVFGAWGWGYAPDDDEEDWEAGYDEPKPPPVPYEKRGKVLSADEAKEYMDGWEFNGSYGAPDSYATYIWTNERVIWVTQYDGATWLSSAPRHPIDMMPEMPGGG